MTVYQFDAGDVIFYEGKPAEHFFVLQEGEVELFKQPPTGEEHLAQVTAGELFGEIAVYDPRAPRPHTARATVSSIIQVLSIGEYETLLQQTPELLTVFVHSAMTTLQKRELAASSPAVAPVAIPMIASSPALSVVSPSLGIQEVNIKPASSVLDFSPVPVSLALLPFRIGGYNNEGMNLKNRQNHLNLAQAGKEMLISRNHCQLEIIEDSLQLIDLGSRHTTVVNGTNIGRGKGRYRMPLQKGENEVILGGRHSPCKILILCE
jgi:hypothetical protein